MAGQDVDEENLDEMWKEAQTEFRRLTGRNLNADRVLTVQDVLAQIQEEKYVDEKSSAKYVRAVSVIHKTLTLIENLGGFAADVASQVFGPANFCFGAAFHLIATVRNYSKIFDGLNELFERISAFSRDSRCTRDRKRPV
ncbi:hypothetical protein VTO42DRAFT_8115 [Malbranchea cinnamomea]